MWESDRVIYLVTKFKHLFLTMETVRNLYQLANIILFETHINCARSGDEMLGKEFLPVGHYN